MESASASGQRIAAFTPLTPRGARQWFFLGDPLTVPREVGRLRCRPRRSQSSFMKEQQSGLLKHYFEMGTSAPCSRFFPEPAFENWATEPAFRPPENVDSFVT
jgi:hypothetical protein